MPRFRVTTNRSRPLQVLLVILTLLSLTGLAAQAERKSAESPQTAAVEGTVCDAQAQPLTGVAVHLRFQSASEEAVMLSDKHGKYRFTALRPGAYTLRADVAGRGTTSFGPFSVRAGETKDVQLMLPPAASSKLSSNSLQFFEQPQFTIAGVMDSTNLGGHASNATAPAKDELAREIATLSPGFSPSPAAKSVAGGAALTLHDRAELHRLLGDKEEKEAHPLQAAREYERAAKLEPSEPNLFSWGAELLLHRATEPALEVFSNGHNRFPLSVRMLLGLGVAWLAQGSYDRAASCLCRAADLDPTNPRPYLFLGKIQEVEASPSACIAERLARFVHLHPEDAQANYYYALSLRKQSESKTGTGSLAQQAASLLRKAVHLDPAFAPAYLQLGILSAKQKQYREAIFYYRKASAANPRLPDPHFRLAQAYMRTGERLKAHAEMQAYETLANAKAQEDERERRHMQQFVYTLRTPSSSQPR